MGARRRLAPCLAVASDGCTTLLERHLPRDGHGTQVYLVPATPAWTGPTRAGLPVDQAAHRPMRGGFERAVCQRLTTRTTTRFVDDVVDVILRTRKEDPTHA
jgi:hypothetical protein